MAPFVVTKQRQNQSGPNLTMLVLDVFIRLIIYGILGV